MRNWPLRFSADCKGQVWNIVCAREAPILLLELRNPPSSVSYGLLDLTNMEYRIVHPQTEAWWSQVIYFDGAHILLNQFEDDRNPDESNLRMLSASNGALLWSRENARLDGAGDGGLIIRQNNKNETCDPANGETVADTEPKYGYPVGLPWHYTEGEEYFQEVSEFIISITAHEPVRAIDYFETGDTYVLTYYTRNGNKLDLHILGGYADGAVVLNEKIETNLEGIADPTFLIVDRNVIFVKEKQHFFVYGLSTE